MDHDRDKFSWKVNDEEMYVSTSSLQYFLKNHRLYFDRGKAIKKSNHYQRQKTITLLDLRVHLRE